MSTPTPTLSLHQLALYNTGRMTPARIMEAFAVRDTVLGRILEDLKSEPAQSRAQHHLVIGQRGMGKTMLLHRIAAELTTHADLSLRFIPLVFAEEQYAVDRLSKFWLNCLDSLADACEQAGDTQGADSIDLIVRGLKSGLAGSVANDGPAADQVLTAFLKAAQARNQRPVLLVDNLQLVFERLEKPQQHALRELLMRPGSPVLIGASPSPPPESQDYGAAFYDHFKIHYLRPLSVEEMRALLLHLATVTARDDVRERVARHPERLEVLRQLTGGNPRTTVALFFLYAEDFAPSVFGDLENLLDRVTPLYKARFEEFTPQQQVIASAIASHWDPVTATRIGELVNLPSGTISSQLDRLEKVGFIEKVELHGESRAGYQLAERFFNIWFLMRSASRRQRREVEFLTRFIESFYEPPDRRLVAGRLMSERDFSCDRYLLSQALADSLDHPETAGDLTRHAELDALRQKALESRARLEEIIDFKALPPAVLEFDELRRKLESLVPAGSPVTPEEFAEQVLGDRHLFRTGERERLAARPGKLAAAEVEQILASTVSSQNLDIANYSETAVSWFSKRLSSGQLSSARNAADWDRAFIQASDCQCLAIMVKSLPHRMGEELAGKTVDYLRQELQPRTETSAFQWLKWGSELHFGLHRYEEAEVAYRKAIGLDRKAPWPWSGIGLLLMDHFRRYREAEAAYREAIKLDSKNAMPWNGLGLLLHQHLQRYDEAEAAYREAIALEPGNALSWHALGLLLHEHLHSYKEAEAVYREAIKLDSKNTLPWNGLGLLLQQHLQRYEEAEAAYREAIALDPENAGLRNNLGNLYADYLQRFDDAAAAYAEALSINPSDESALLNIVFLQRDFLGVGGQAKTMMDRLQAVAAPIFPDSLHLQKALFAAYDENWGLACESLASALDLISGGFKASNTDDWMRASAVLLHLDKGAALLAFLESRGDDARLRPWYEALRAHGAGDRALLRNVAPEVRTLAEKFYDEINRRLIHLPEKTSRRPKPVSGKKRASAARAKRG